MKNTFVVLGVIVLAGVGMFLYSYVTDRPLGEVSEEVEQYRVTL